MNTKLYTANNYYKTLERLEKSLQSGRFVTYSQYKKQQIWNRLKRYARQLGISIKSSLITACIAAGLCLSSGNANAQITFTPETGINNPLDAVDVHYNSTPAFVDIDGDGDFDCFVGTYNGTISYYKNTGTSTMPVFVQQTGTNNPLNSVNLTYPIVPFFVDIDGDGDKDLFIGLNDGTVIYYKNVGTATAPSFVLQAPAANPLNGITNGADYAIPVFVDIDGDGDFDLFLAGSHLGNILYFKNTGTATAPVFTAETGAANPFNGFIASGYYAAPAFADLDGDGDLDAVIGSGSGSFAYFENTGSSTTPIFTPQTGSNNPLNGITLSYVTTPAFVDIDGDGDQDLFSGEYYGKVYYFKNTTGALPLTLIRFAGIGHDGFNQIQWTTSAELNTKSFELEHSSDGITFTQIATVAATDNTNNNYSAVDNNIAGGKMYYRLKMIDIDGRYTYSQVIWINNGNSKGIVIYPNPATNTVNINMGYLQALKTKASVYNADGKLIENIEISDNQLQIDISGYTKGKYFIRFTDGAVRSFIKN